MRISVLLIVGAALGCTAGRAVPAPRPATTPPVERHAARQEGGWGWGCGGHCAINYSMDSAITLTLGPGESAAASDEGKLVMRENDPGGGFTDTTLWRYVWSGTLEEAGAAKIVHLRPVAVSCMTTHRSDAEDETEASTPCKTPPTIQELRCEPATVAVEGEPAPIDVLQCDPPPLSTVADGQSIYPWVFGTRIAVRMKIGGEPHPIKTYVREP